MRESAAQPLLPERRPQTHDNIVEITMAERIAEGGPSPYEQREYMFGDLEIVLHTVEFEAKKPVHERLATVMGYEEEIAEFFGEEDHDGDVTGQIVWEVAGWFCRFMVAHPALFRGKRILELGAGTGS